jgi:hypothetical protein
MKKYCLGTLALILLFTLVGCGGGGGTNRTETGTVSGLVYAPDEITPIVGASVTVRGTTLSITTNTQGAYTLTGVPVGLQKIIAAKGSYRAETSVTVTKGQTVNAEHLVLAPIGKIGVVKGLYDDIGEVLSSLGITYELITDPNATFSDQATLSQYAVIFFECGLNDWFLMEEVNVTNLQDFVVQGGSIYTSDWASCVIDAMYPDKIEFAGKSGIEQTITATITNTEIQSLLGKSTASICFDLGSWEVIDSVATGVTVDLRGTVQTDYGEKTNIPLMVHFSQGKGNVVYTSFHNEAQVTEDVEKILNHLVFAL